MVVGTFSVALDEYTASRTFFVIRKMFKIMGDCADDISFGAQKNMMSSLPFDLIPFIYQFCQGMCFIPIALGANLITNNLPIK